MEKWQIASSKTLVRDKYLTIRVDTCIAPTGGTVDPYYVFEYGNWANCVVFDKNGDLIMIRQYRHGINDFVSEIVAGGLEKDDPSPEAGIRRELEEEIGYVGGSIYQTGISYPNPGSQTNKVYSFLAVGGECSKEPSHEVGESITIEKHSLGEVMDNLGNLNSGIIYQSMHITSLFSALIFIKSSSLKPLQELMTKLSERIH
jgi:ADP-ribose pyrophosphatase